MDGVMFMHHKRLLSLIKQLNDPFCGDIQKILSSFSFNGLNTDFLNSNIRTKIEEDPLGAMGDLGWYCIRLGIIAFNKGNDKLLKLNGFNWPKECTALCSKWSAEGVPLECDATVFFSSDDEPVDRRKKIVFDCSFLLPFRQTYEISIMSKTQSKLFTCDKVIKCDDFVIPRNPSSSSFSIEAFPTGGNVGPLGDFSTKVMSNIQNFNIESDHDQEVNMFLEFNRIFRDNDMKSKNYYKMIALLTQTVIDSCMLSMRLDGKSVAVDVSSVKSFFN